MRPGRRLSRGQAVAVRAGVLAVGGLLAAGAAVLVTLVPPTAGSFYPKCQLHSLTGLHCPGCGLTRFAAALASGDLRQAAAYNVVALVALPFVAAYAARQLWAWVWGVTPRRLLPPAWSRRLSIGFVAVLVVFFIVRNVPVAPFTLLAPHEVSR